MHLSQAVEAVWFLYKAGHFTVSLMFLPKITSQRFNDIPIDPQIQHSYTAPQAQLNHHHHHRR
jgi:hypothetical protein